MSRGLWFLMILYVNYIEVLSPSSPSTTSSPEPRKGVASCFAEAGRYSMDDCWRCWSQSPSSRPGSRERTPGVTMIHLRFTPPLGPTSEDRMWV